MAAITGSRVGLPDDNSLALKKAESYRPSNAIIIWATIGAIALVVALSGLVRWVFSADFVATPTGPDPYPYLTTLRVVETVSVLFLLYFAYACVIRPLLREKQLSFDGMLFCGTVLVAFTDPLFNNFGPTFLQNAYSFNRGSWANFIPGYVSPAGDAGYVESILWAVPLIGVFGFLAALVGCSLLQKLRRRFADIRNSMFYGLMVYGGMFVIYFLADTLVEIFYTRNEIYIYWGAWSPLTLWAGEIYQYPLYNSALAAGYALGFVWLRDSRDDNGLSFVQRGVNAVTANKLLRTLMSFCGVVGFCFVWSVTSYYGPFMFSSMKADSFPHLPSYLRGGAYCGTENKPLCPSQILKQSRE